MPSTPYKRVDLSGLDSATTPATGGAPPPVSGSWRRWMFFVLPLSLLMCVTQGVTVILAENLRTVYISSTLIAVIAFMTLLVVLLVINPAIRLLFRGLIRPLSRVEMITLFATIMVSSGISSFGLTSQLVPIIPTPWNPEWNTPQRGWDTDVLPHLNQKLYITDADQVRLYREGVPVARPPESAPFGEKFDYYVQVIKKVPW